MRPLSILVFAGTLLLMSCLIPGGVASASAADDTGPAPTRPTRILEQLFAEIPAGVAPSGVLHDRVLPLSGLRELDGGVYAPTVDLRRWLQAYHEIRGASAHPEEMPETDRLRRLGPAAERGTVIPLAVLDRAYDRLREDAFDRGLASVSGERLRLATDALEEARVFSAVALRDRTYRGEELEFQLSAERYFGERGQRPIRCLLDADDGLRLREMESMGPGFRARVRYESAGRKELRLSAIYADGTVRTSSFSFLVEALAAPAPDDTLQLTASVPYQGSAASGEAYLYYAEGRSSLAQPVVLVEGFDLDNSLNWDEIYDLLNTENLLEDLRAAGYDLVVLNFDDATTEIQRNSLLVVELMQQVQSLIDPRAKYTLAGASMGGLCTRYALLWMEQNGIPHRVNTWISFDAPHGGANIPLGLQYWLDFFSGQSDDADFLLSRLDRPAARQLLAYHHLSAAGTADPLRASFLADLATLGDYPTGVRSVTIANGSGAGQDQGYAPGAQLIRWEYNEPFTQITGNVWAVGDGPNTRIFDGNITIFFITIDDQEIFVAGTDPFDSAPGGSRASLAQADSTEAPYGDIVALHPSHCFIPTISALALDTTDLFFDVDGAGDLTALSPFDAVYFPATNEEHVQVTAQNAQWIKDEIFGSPTAVSQRPVLARDAVLLPNVPNPFNPRTTLRYELFETGPVQLEIFDVRGRLVRTLISAVQEPGEHRASWNGEDDHGHAVGSGMYLARLRQSDSSSARRLILAR